MKRAAIVLMLLLAAVSIDSRTVTSRPAPGAGADEQPFDCSSWMEARPVEGLFSVRFPASPSHSRGKLSDGKKWDMYIAGEGDKSFSVRYRKRGSDETKWSQLIFDELELSHRPDRNIRGQSACILNGYSTIEEVRKGVAGHYWRDLRIFTDEYFFTVSMEARTVEEVESGEAQCFFESFTHRSASPLPSQRAFLLPVRAQPLKPFTRPLSSRERSAEAAQQRLDAERARYEQERFQNFAARRKELTELEQSLSRIVNNITWATDVNELAAAESRLAACRRVLATLPQPEKPKPLSPEAQARLDATNKRAGFDGVSEPETVQALVKRELENYKALVLTEDKLKRRVALREEKRYLLARVAAI